MSLGSYSTQSLFIGWYARFTVDYIRQQTAWHKSLVCPRDANHPSSGVFCSTCGEALQEKGHAVFSSYPSPKELMKLYYKQPAKLPEATFGHVNAQDVQALGESYLLQQRPPDCLDHIIIAPGMRFFGHHELQTFVAPIDEIAPAPPAAWLEQVKKVFHASHARMEFGLVYERDESSR